MMLGGEGALTGGGRTAGVPLPLVQGALPRPVAFRLALFFHAMWSVTAATTVSIWLAVAPHPLAGVFLTLVAAVATSLVVVVLVGAAMRFALGFGEQRGRLAERERHRRDVHDTVLQVMESLALPAPDDVLDPVGSLDQVRRTARAHALRLRLSLGEDALAEPGGLTHRLGALAVEMTAEGLRVEVVTLSKIADVPEAAVHALHDAAREALRNTLKHAATTRAVICVEDTGDGVTVSVRDHGSGFDFAGRRPGFGIDNSIIARLAEIGGTAWIDSAPGQGTRVVLTAPLALRVAVG